MIGCGLGKKMGESGGVWRSDGWEKGVGFFQKEKGEDSGSSHALSLVLSIGKR